MSTELTVFNEFETGLVLLEASNAEMEFDNSPDGLAERRAWYKKFRKGTNALPKLRKATNDESQKKIKDCNAEAKAIQSRLDIMELPHKTILDAEEARVQKEIDDLAEKNRLEAEAKEAERLKELEEREAKAQAIIDKAAEVEAALVAKQVADELEKQIEADKLKAVEEAKQKAVQEAKEAAEKVEDDKKAAAALAEKEKAEAIAETKRKAEAEAERLKKEISDKYAKEQTEKEEAKKIEADRIADQAHRAKVEQLIVCDLNTILRDIKTADLILRALKQGSIRNVDIKY